MTPKQEVLSYVLSTAVEGGINYWANDRDDQNRLQVIRIDRDSNGDYLSIVFDRRAVENVSGTKVSAFVTDLDGNNEVAVDFKALTRGLRAIVDYKVTFGGKPLEQTSQMRRVALALLFAKSNDDAPDYDAGDADSLVQAALFGDIVYG